MVEHQRQARYLTELIAGVIPLTSLVLDGHFGHHNALHLARQSHLHLISKFRCDAALSFPYAGLYAGWGPRRKYGSQVDDGNMPAKYLKETTVEGHIQTRVYQAPLLHTEFAQPLPGVIITKLNLHTYGRAHVLLLSRDLTLAYAPRVDDHRFCKLKCSLLGDFFLWRGRHKRRRSSDSLATERGTVTYLQVVINAQGLQAVIEELGYEVPAVTGPTEDVEQKAREQEIATLRRKFIVAALLSTLVIVGSMPELVPWWPAILTNHLILWA
jgi:hypothetical protein